MFLRRSEFYMTIRFSHAFLLIFWVGGLGGEAPQKILGIFRLFLNIFVLVKLFFAFLRGSGSEAPENFLRFFSFLTQGGATENFSWLFDLWKKSRGGYSEENFFLTSFFYGYAIIYSLAGKSHVTPRKMSNFFSLGCVKIKNESFITSNDFAMKIIKCFRRVDPPDPSPNFL